MREHILIANGSNIMRWWLVHHYLAIVLSVILLTWFVWCVMCDVCLAVCGLCVVWGCVLGFMSVVFHVVSIVSGPAGHTMTYSACSSWSSPSISVCSFEFVFLLLFSVCCVILVSSSPPNPQHANTIHRRRAVSAAQVPGCCALQEASAGSLRQHGGHQRWVDSALLFSSTDALLDIPTPGLFFWVIGCSVLVYVCMYICMCTCICLSRFTPV